MLKNARTRRFALLTLFSMPGVAIASWVTRTPAIRDALGASTAEMGLVLFGLSIGSITGILSSGPLAARFGTKPVIIAGMSSVTASMVLVAVGALVGAAPLVAVGLALFGLGMGGSEVALNIEGADLEQVTQRTVLPAMHGCFSLGTVVGASIGIVFSAAEFSVVVHLISVSVFALALFIVGILKFGPGLPPTPRTSPSVAEEGTSTPLWRDTTLVLIGVIVMAMAFAEGAATDWLPLVMVDGHGFEPGWGSAIYALFAAAMTVGRFSGAWILQRVTRVNVVRASAVLAAVGLAGVVFVDHQPVAAAAVVLWGLGASLGFPLALTAAGESGSRSHARVALVATLGYVAFLIGPPLLGFIGEHISLRYALLLVMVLILLALITAPAVRVRKVDTPAAP